MLPYVSPYPLPLDIRPPKIALCKAGCSDGYSTNRCHDVLVGIHSCFDVMIPYFSVSKCTIRWNMRRIVACRPASWEITFPRLVCRFAWDTYRYVSIRGFRASDVLLLRGINAVIERVGF